MAQGVVTEFDDAKGWGTVTTGDGAEVFFHCTAIADGTRTIPDGTEVRFEIVAGRQGRYEASGLQPV